MNRFRVLIADDERLVAHNIAKNVQRVDPDFEVVGVVTDGELALEQAASLMPHVVITDIKMPVLDGLELMRRLSDAQPEIRVVVVSGYDDFELVRAALRQNACDYLLKPINPDSLRATLSKLKAELCARQQTLVSENDPRRISDAVKRYLRENLASEVSFTAMAGELGFSASYLARVFKEHNEGQTPARYLSELRMTAAKRLLVDTALPVKEIAARVGYPDPFHFSKSFKQLAGVSPAQFRAAYTGSAEP